MYEAGEISEIIVVDDGSSDESAEIAASFDGVSIHRLEGQNGPAAARNFGARHANGSFIWFLDADVVVHDDAARVLAHSLRMGAAAVFGSYGDCPAANNFLSQYKNLVHHYTHQQHRGDTDTFWTGCGAVRREAFEAVNGFDGERFRATGMEDIDFGYRLSAAGYRIWLEPALQGEHRKRWTLVNLLRVEIFHRALPWSRLMLEREHTQRTLNIDRGEQIRAALAGAGALSLVLLPTPWIGWPPAAALCGVIAFANRRLLRFFWAKRGGVFALRALLFHQLYYLYSATTFVYAGFEHRLLRRGRR